MSILDKPAIPEITPAIRTAAQIKQSAQATYRQLLTAFEAAVRLFWQNSQATPAEIAAALGTDAREAFQLHAKLGAFLNEVKPGCINNAMGVVGEVTYNDDGTVTVKPKPSVLPQYTQNTPPAQG